MNNRIYFFLSIFLTLFVFACSKDYDANYDKSNPIDGKSGSTARMVTKGNYLYVVDNSTLKVYDISNPSNPAFLNTANVGMDIETIYPFGEHLFIGSMSGMYVYGLQNPAQPNFISNFTHISACDPVVANDDFAFITLRSSNQCGRWVTTNGQIDIVNIQNINSPYLVKSQFTDTNPFGLDLKDTLLFVCHGTAGLKLYDTRLLTDPYNQSNVVVGGFQQSGFTANDVILWQDKVYVIGDNGFYQLEYNNVTGFNLISTLAIK